MMSKKERSNLTLQMTASFCGVILLGLVGYFHTVHVLQASQGHSRRTNEIINLGLSQTNEAAQAAQQMSANTVEFVYSGSPHCLKAKRESDAAVHQSFTNLKTTLDGLANGADLLRLVRIAQKQNSHVCEPLEDSAIRLAQSGHARQAQDRIGSDYEVSHVRFAQDIAEVSGHLLEYQALSEGAERAATREAVIGGWIVQALILAASLLVAFRMAGIIHLGLKQVLQAEEAARSAHEMLQSIMDTIPQQIFWKDSRSVYLGCNRNFAQAVGCEGQEEIAGKTDFELPWDQEEVDRLQAVDRRVMDSNSPEYGVLKPTRQPDGCQSWAETNHIPLHDAEGKVVGILGTVEDITEQKQAEESLRESDARLRTVIASIPVIVFALDRQGQFAFCDGKGLAELGLTPDQVVGRAIHDVYSDTPALIEHLHLALTGVPHAWTVEVNGRIHETQAMPLHASSGEFTGIVGAAYDVTEHKRLEDQLTHQAFHDTLTSLPNRALFRDRLEHALVRARRRHAAVSVLFVDLDNFKIVNDSLGHQAGDTLLLAVAERLNLCLRQGDTLARLGGDEFTILLDEVPGLETATQIAARISEVLHEPLLLAGHSLSISASIGITISNAVQSLAEEAPSAESEAEDLLRDADIAMYQAKNGGKAGYVVFDSQMTIQIMERMEMEIEMRRLLDSEDGDYGELVLHYQPIVSLETGIVREIEALVRWNHPRHGLIPPAKFIPMAEETGLIVPLGTWVLRQACREAKRLEAEFPNDQPLVIGVNLSAKQLEQPNLVEIVTEILQESGLFPQNLKLEITESVMMERAEPVLDKLRRLREMGIKLAIDDFGTGYSSMACLNDFPLDTLKIDRSFIEKMHEPDGMAIVQAIVMLAQVLHLQVTCEGIETLEQWDQLRSLACDRGQGYYFARPQTSEALTEILNTEADEASAALENTSVLAGLA